MWFTIGMIALIIASMAITYSIIMGSSYEYNLVLRDNLGNKKAIDFQVICNPEEKLLLEKAFKLIADSSTRSYLSFDKNGAEVDISERL